MFDKVQIVDSEAEDGWKKEKKGRKRETPDVQLPAPTQRLRQKSSAGEGREKSRRESEGEGSTTILSMPQEVILADIGDGVLRTDHQGSVTAGLRSTGPLCCYHSC